MGGRRFVGMVGAVALVAPLTGWVSMPVAASAVSTPAAVPASVCFPSTDNGDPVLKTFDFGPRAVDSRGGEQTMTFAVTGEDTGGPGAPSGITKGHVYVNYDDTNPANWTLSAPLTPDGQGGFVASLTIRPEFQSGTRWVSVSLEDAAGNSAMYSWDDLAQLGLPATFTATTNPDTVTPSVRSVHLSSATIDTRRRARHLTVRIRATDDSGVASMRVWLYGWAGRSPETRAHLVTGTPKDGTWQGRLRIGRWQGNQDAKIAIELADVVGRYRGYGARKLEAIDQPGRVRIVSRTEPEAPRIQLRSLTPNPVDLHNGTQSVTVVARVLDRGSGARQVAVSLSGPQRPDGESSANARLRRVSGTSHDGVWKAIVTLPQCDTVPGAWRAVVFAWDAAQGDYRPSRTPLTVLNADIQRPYATVAGDTYEVRRAGPLTVEFDEDVVGVSADNALVHVGSNRRGLAGEDPPVVAGTWTCKDAAGSAVDCAAGPVRTAAFTPTSPMFAGTNHTLLFNPEHHLGLTDLAGNPYNPAAPLDFRTG